MKDNRTGGKAAYDTRVDISEKDGEIIFRFSASHSSLHCTRKRYNGIHSTGDACEVLIGSDPTRSEYYEIEINPQNKLMVAKMSYLGVDASGNPVLKIGFVPKKECFVRSEVKVSGDSYTAALYVRKDKVSAQGEPYFNAYRLETDGGETDKHLFALNPTMCGKFHVPARYVRLSEYVKD